MYCLRQVIVSPGGCFRFPICCSVSKPQRLKCEHGQKSRPNFVVSDPPPVNIRRRARNVRVSFSCGTQDTTTDILLTGCLYATINCKRNNLKTLPDTCAIHMHCRQHLQYLQYIRLYGMQNETNTEVERVSNNKILLQNSCPEINRVFRSERAVDRFNLYRTFKRNVFGHTSGQEKMA